MELRRAYVLLVAVAAFSWPIHAQTFDLVIHGGRVIDPETHLDAVRDIGINGGMIRYISLTPLQGKRILDATGLVVAPGFIDLHQHGQQPEDYRLKAFDGVTTALEMEIGTPDVAGFLENRGGKSLINFGTTADYDAARALAFGLALPNGTNLPRSGLATNTPASPSQIKSLLSELRKQIDAGALGIGMGIEYVPGASYDEVLQVFRLAAAAQLPVYAHLRSSGRTDPGSAISSVSEVIADSAITGAPIHIAHINSTCTKQAPECLSMIAGARAHGVDVTTEAYPYAAGMTQINSALFNPGWQTKLGISYSDLALLDTGQRLTEPLFDQMHADPSPHLILLYKNDDATVDQTIINPLVMIASDGAIGHPREAGTFSRVLARYVREQKSLGLMDAIEKMTLMPAKVLAASTPVAARKGRLQVNADADIVAFDPQQIADRATYSRPSIPSVGMRFVIVHGEVIIANGELRPDVFPGQAVLGKSKNDTQTKP
jgi:N-acyl-D-aspartate/D-glutamate deacylase